MKLNTYKITAYETVIKYCLVAVALRCMLAMQAIQVSNRIDVKSTTNTQPTLLSFSTWGKRLDTKLTPVTQNEAPQGL